MKHRNLRGEDHRTEETKERDRQAAKDEKELIRKKTVGVNIGGGGEPMDSGRNSGASSNETRCTER